MQLRTVILLFGFSFTSSFAQPDSLWSLRFGEAGIDQHWHENFALTADDELLIIRESPTEQNRTDNILTSIRTDGRVNYERVIADGGDFFNIQSMVVTSEGDIVMTGGSPLEGPNCDVLLIGYQPDGRLMLSRRYFNPPSDHGISLIQTADGGFLIAGYYGVEEFNRYDSDLWLIRTDAFGDSVWSRRYGNRGRYEQATTVVESADGGFYVAGIQAGQPLMIKYNSEGTLLWTLVLEEEGALHTLLPLEEGCIAAGFILTDRGDFDGWLIRFNDNGQIIWQRSVGGNANDVVKDAVAVDEQSIAFAGGTGSMGNGDSDYWLFKTNLMGELFWQCAFGGSDYDEADALLRTKDGRTALVGNTRSFDAMHGDIWLVMAGPDRETPYLNSLSLADGWNLISSVIPPEMPNQEDVWRELINRGTLEMVKDQDGRFMLPRRFNNMPPWNVCQGYFAKVSEPDTLLIVNPPVTPETPIPLRRHWNIVAYFPYEPNPPSLVFDNLGDNLIIVKDAEGRFFLPEIGFDNMGDLKQGNGYLVKVHEPDTLIWTVWGNVVHATPKPTESPRHFIAVARTPANMSVLLDGEWSQGEIGVLTADGLCVGASVIGGNSRTNGQANRYGLAVWGDDPVTTAVDGAMEGEPLRFLVWDGTAERSLKVKWLWGDGNYRSDGIIWGEVEAITTDGIPTFKQTDFHFVPNPFNSRITFSVEMATAGSVSLELRDIQGRAAATVFRGDLSRGGHNFTLNGDDLPAGVYLAVMNYPGGQSVHKVAHIQ